MRAGLPIITTPVGALPEILKNGKNGYLIEPGEISLFVDKILYLMRHKRVRQSMSARNVDASYNFSPFQYSKKLEGIFEGVLNMRSYLWYQ